MSDERSNMQEEKKLGVTELQSEISAWAQDKGWWQQFDRETVQAKLRYQTGALTLGENNYIGTKIALIHSEASEAIEALRDGDFQSTGAGGKPEGLRSELADVIVRTLDLAAALGFDMEEALREKVAYNHTRAHKHGGKAV